MTQKSSREKISGHSQQDAKQSTSAGPDAVAIAPPTYGIDFLDQGLAQAGTGLPSNGKSAIQRKADLSTAGGDVGARPENRTGLPGALKSAIERLSGLALDDVRVYTNSSKPAQLQALAYTQGTEIHVGPGQERHLPHEAWHVVQQKQGRVKPTFQMKNVHVNDNTGLEKEADMMGAKAFQHSSEVAQRKADPHTNDCGCAVCTPASSAQVAAKTIQRKIKIEGQEFDKTGAALILINVLEKNNSIPGTINELKAVINEMILDKTDRTELPQVINDLQEKMAKVYKDRKNIANIELRGRFPEKAFLDTDTPEDLHTFTKTEILGKDIPAELGYLVSPETGKVLGAGLGGARVIQPHEIGADETVVKWDGGILTHSHPSGSPHTIPNDIVAAVSKSASQSKVLTRDFTFTININYKNPAIIEYQKQSKLADLKMALLNTDFTGQQKWEQEAQDAGYDGLIYDPDSAMNAQEKELLVEEFKKSGDNPQRWTMVNDYGMGKFMGYQQVATDFKSKGLDLSSSATKESYLEYREKFYKGSKKKKVASLEKDKSPIDKKKTTMIKRQGSGGTITTMKTKTSKFIG
jgi:hypothetical protein